MIFIVKLVGTRLERTDEEVCLMVGRKQLLRFEVVAFKLSWRRVVIPDDEANALIGGYRQLRWRELMVLEYKGERLFLRRRAISCHDAGYSGYRNNGRLFQHSDPPGNCVPKSPYRRSAGESMIMRIIR